MFRISKGVSTQNKAGSRRPRLSLNFANGKLDSRVTFSRTSNATLTGSNGLIQYAPHNLLTYSQEFDNAAWLKNSVTVTPNATTAPDGTLTADLLTGTGAGAVYCYRQYATSAGVPFVVSDYVKNFNVAGSAIVWLRDFTEAGLAAFSLTNGTVTSTTGIASEATITPVGDGWYRISAKFTPTTSSSHNVAAAHIGDSLVTTGIYAWGAQLNVGALQPYYPTTNAAYYAPRFDYDPITLAPKGLLIEEQRTNLLTYSDGKVANLGLNYGVTDAASPISASFTNSIQFADNSATKVAYKSMTATALTVYTLSVYIRMDDNSAPIVGAFANVGDFSLVVEGVVLPATVTNTGSNVYRVTRTFTSVGEVAANYGVVKYNTQTNKGFRVTGYQLEAGAFPTSYIPTTSAQVTRAADNASMTGTNFSSWYNQNEGTICISYSGSPRGSSLWLGDAIRSPAIGENDGGDNVRVSLLGIEYMDTGGTFTVAGQAYKTAFAYKVGAYGSSTNGEAVQVSSSANTPGVTSSIAIGSVLNSTIKQITYYPRRLTNAELQAITS